MVSCITGAARREIVLFYQMGVAEMMKRFSQQKYNESQGQEYLNRKQESGEDTREC